MKDVTITLLDEHGSDISDVFDNVPVTIPKDEWVDNGVYIVNMKEIDFGTPSRDVVVNEFMMTTGVGFFSSAKTTPVGGGPIEMSPRMSLSLGKQDLEVDKKLVE